MKSIMKRVLSGTLTLTLMSGMLLVPAGAAGKIDAFGRSYARVPGGTYYAEQTAPQVYTSHIENYECPQRPGQKHVLEYQNVAATCDQDGIMARVCQVCGETEIMKESETLGHDYQSKVTREPTAQREGEETFTCTRCGDVYTEVLPKLEQTPSQSQEQNPEPEKSQSHTHAWTEKETPATCTEGGERYRVCEQCGARETLRTLTALGHDYQSQITRKPTATMTGLKTFICARCDDVYTEVLPKLGQTSDQSQTQKPEQIPGQSQAQEPGQTPGQTTPSEEDGILTGKEPTGTCIDAFGRSYARVVGGTYYAEQYQRIPSAAASSPTTAPKIPATAISSLTTSRLPPARRGIPTTTSALFAARKSSSWTSPPWATSTPTASPVRPPQTERGSAPSPALAAGTATPRPFPSWMPLKRVRWRRIPAPGQL